MERQIRDADYVLVVCTETYYRRVMGDEESGVGRGVIWEGGLIYQDMYDAYAENTRFIPVLFETDWFKFIPRPLKATTYYVVDTTSGYEDLYRRLTNQPYVERPELGKLKKLPPRERRTDFLEGEPADAEGRLAELPLDEIPPIAPLPPGSRMPLSPNPLFVGREADLNTLAAALKGGETAAIGQIAAATGMGGIGKTQLAAEFVYRYGRFFAGGVFWLSFANPEAVPAEVAACGGRGYLNLAPDFETLDLPTQVRLVLSAWASPTPRLLVFDNCEEEALLAQWRPSTGGCRVLVASRRASWDAALGVGALPLGVLSRAEALSSCANSAPIWPRMTPRR
jgi:hypothetical protein